MISYSRQTSEVGIISFLARGGRVVRNGMLPFNTVLERGGGGGFSFEWLQRKGPGQGMLP